jgi:hypothetical protein
LPVKLGSTALLSVALLQWRQIELIPQHTGEIFFALPCGAKGALVNRVRDGLGAHCAARCTLIELLPEVPVPS